MRESIQEYVNSCDYAQLACLIERATARQKHLSSAGKIRVFGVFSSKDSAKWFTNLNDAQAAFVEAAKADIDERFPEVSLQRNSIFIEDLSEYIGEESAKQYLKGATELLDKETEKPLSDQSRVLRAQDRGGNNG